jgi:type VI secretion system secreted protein VgrG
LELALEGGETSLSVRRFSVREALSRPFTVLVWARAPSAEIDLTALVERGAALRAATGRAAGPTAGVRCWSGICSAAELLQAEPAGLSTYSLEIVPALWLLSQRTDHRIFQHLAIPDIVDRILDEWRIERRWRIDRPAYPPLEIRTQYGETDLDFVSRLLAEAGISYSFAEDPDERSRLVLHDAPQTRAPRGEGSIAFADNPNPEADTDYVSALRLGERVRPHGVVLQDHDFRRVPKFSLAASAGRAAIAGGVASGPGKDANGRRPLEIFAWIPGSFVAELSKLAKEQIGRLGGKLDDAIDLSGAQRGLGRRVKDAVGAEVEKVVDQKIEGAIGTHVKRVLGPELGGAVTDLAGDLVGEVAGVVAGEVAGHLVGKLVGDDKGVARALAQSGNERALVMAQSLGAERRVLSFETNAVDLAPGVVVGVAGHPRGDLGPDGRLLVTELTVDGAHDGDWHMSARAVGADVAWRPPLVTPKPRVQGLQSAMVVGPPGQEIYTDELGRVRVQFHWDRQGRHDDNSSCWMRVTQGWAGAGYGLVALPRVGHEVLVAFLEGDPDNPIVVGSLHNAAAPGPYRLPEHKTRSVWRSASSPGADGYNEIMFEDKKGGELVHVQAERDLEKIVKRHECESTGGNREVTVTGERRTRIGTVDENVVGASHLVRVEPHARGTPTTFEMLDKRIALSTGEASIVLDGPNITLLAKGVIKIKSAEGDVEIQGGPWVKINCDAEGVIEGDTYVMHHITGILRDQDGEPLAGRTLTVKGSDGAVQSVTTDASGRYFALVPAGRVEVALPGGRRYGSRSRRLDDMTLEPVIFDDLGPAV